MLTFRSPASKGRSAMSDPPPTVPLPRREGVVRDSEAEYTLEYQATCPKCGQALTTIKVIRLLRSRVNFVSTLPRHGRVLACPLCRCILSGELTLT
jgi:hypothetical protein